jgi:hypothetical protein
MDMSDFIFLAIVLGSGLGPLIAKFSKKKAAAGSITSPRITPKGTGIAVGKSMPTGQTTVQRAIGRRPRRPKRVHASAGREAKAAPAAPVAPVAPAPAATRGIGPPPARPSAPGHRHGNSQARHWTLLQRAVVFRELLDRPKALRGMPPQVDLGN